MRKAALVLTVALLGLSPLTARAVEPIAVTPSTQAPAAPAATPAPATFSDAQRAEIENIIKEYLTEKNPKVLAQAIQVLQQREQADTDKQLKDAIAKAKDRVYNDPASPVGGNPKGNVTIVEFFDYQCGYCKMSEETVEKLLGADKNIKFVYKNFPILGAPSTEAAKASQASVKQGKFAAFHTALMNKKDRLSTEVIQQTAKEVGLDVEKLKKDMEDKSVLDAISANLKLGQELGVHGTPLFIIGDEVFPGALQSDQMKQVVDAVRAKAKK